MGAPHIVFRRWLQILGWKWRRCYCVYGIISSDDVYSFGQRSLGGLVVAFPSIPYNYNEFYTAVVHRMRHDLTRHLDRKPSVYHRIYLFRINVIIWTE
jgi:hypothetical protein